MKIMHKFLAICVLSILISLPSLKAMFYQKENVRMTLSYLNKADDERYLTVKVLMRKNRQITYISDLPIGFYLSEISDENYLGSATTDADGIGNFLLPESFYNFSDTLRTYTFLAVLSDNPSYNDQDADLEIREVSLQFDLVEIDSQKTIDVTVAEMDEYDEDVPIEDVEIKVFVERPFGNLPITKEYTSTDEEGFVSVPFPGDLPGDHEGRLNIIVKIEDHFDYGNVERAESMVWGIPLKMEDTTLKRSLWSASANAPILLILFVNGLITIVWGIIFFILYRVYQISRI